MSLYVYESVDEVPKGMIYIYRNDEYFDGGTILKDTEFTARVLREIDSAVRLTNTSFKGRTMGMGALDKSYLSTGSKVLLNVEDNPSKCFNVIECGENALEILVSLRDGSVLWQDPVLMRSDNIDCDIIYKGKQYTRLHDFLRVTMQP